MARRKRAQRALVIPDPTYKSRLVTLLINKVLQEGKKGLSQKIVYTSLTRIAFKTEENPLLVLEKSVRNVTPQVEVKSRRVRGSIYRIPTHLRAYRGTSISLKWIIETARMRSGKSMSINLSNEILDASKGMGKSVKRKEQTHKIASSNKAFAYFRY